MSIDKRQTLAILLATWLMLLQGCGGGGSADLLSATQSLTDANVDTSQDRPLTPATPEDTVSSEVDAELIEVIAGDEPGNDSETDISIEDADEGAESFAESSYKLIPLASDQTGNVSSGSPQSDGASSEPLQPIESTELTGSNDIDAEDSSEVPQAGSNAVEEFDSTGAGIEATDLELTEPGIADQGQDAVERAGLDTITDLILLTGQSNAASLVTRFDAELDAPDQRVFAYTYDGWQVADLHQFWDEGIPGNFSANNPERDPYNNIIFQVGKALAKTANRTVGIVMITAPGEGISHWDYNSPFYNKMRNHAIAALNAVPHKSAFDAVVWMQGETDWLLHGTADPDIPEFESYESEAYKYYYPRKLAGLIEALRSDPWFGNEARFICTETIKAKLNPHLMTLNTDGDSLTGCAAASDLAARENDPHGNHFSAESLRVLGQRIADVYLTLHVID